MTRIIRQILQKYSGNSGDNSGYSGRRLMEKQTHTIDASGKILGRLAAQVVVLLRGKQKAGWLPYITPIDEVAVFNTDKIKVTGKKMKQKIYIHHTGYMGSLKQKSLEDAMAKDSRWVIREAVYGMLPKNRTRDKIIKNLKLYKGKLPNTK